MSTSKIRLDYERLSEEDKAQFLKMHAPKRLKANEVLVRRYRAQYNKELKTFFIPDDLGAKVTRPTVDGEMDMYINVQYQALTKKNWAELEHVVKYNNKLGGYYKDPLGRPTESRIIKNPPHMYRLVTDLHEEIEFIKSITFDAAIPPKAIVNDPGVKSEPNEDLTDSEIYALFNQWEGTKKDFYEKYGVSQPKLKKILESYE